MFLLNSVFMVVLINGVSIFQVGLRMCDLLSVYRSKGGMLSYLIKHPRKAHETMH